MGGGGHRHTVKAGDCIASIAFENGLLPERIWDSSENQALREKRSDMHILLPGDVVFVPAIAAREVTARTGAVHSFRRRAVPERLRVRFLDVNDRPRAGVPYELSVDGVLSRGETDGDGVVLEWIQPSARAARLTLCCEDGDEDYDLEIGHLDPIEEPDGLRARLANLGYPCDDETGPLGPATQRRVREFQDDHHLEGTGSVDDATRAAIVRAHGS